MIKKIVLNSLIAFIAMGLIINNTYAKSTLVTNANASNVQAIATDHGNFVYYMSGNVLYEYNEELSLTKVIATNARRYEAINTNDGILLIYRTNSSQVRLYSQKNGTNRLLHTSINNSSYYNAYLSSVNTNNGPMFYFYAINLGHMSSDIRTLAYSQSNNRTTTVNNVLPNLNTQVKSVYLSIINFYHIYNGNLYVDRGQIGSSRTRLTTHQVAELNPIIADGQIQVFHINKNDGNKLYVYEESSKKSIKLTDNEVSNINVINTDDGIHVYYSNVDDGNSLYLYKLNTNENIKLLNNHVSDISAINTSNGIVLYFSNHDDGKKLYALNTDRFALEEVKSIFVDATYNSIYLEWENPQHDKLQKVLIYKDGQKIGETIVPNNKYLIEGLQPNTEYEIKLTTLYDGGLESYGVKFKVRTLEIPVEELRVKNLRSTKVTHERVNLAWENPVDNDLFEHVTIYRKTIDQSKNASIIENIMFGSNVYADSNEYDPLFETNGTTFNDLTVDPETDYEYLVNTNTKDGREIQGESVLVTTLSEPSPSMGGVDFEENKDGDYVYKWTSPTKGQVKILVGGKEYAIVPASDRQITIQKKDMKYTVMGNPDVRLVPISESGKEGKPINPNIPFSSTQLPLNVDDLLTTSMGFLWLLGPFILLVLAIIIAQKLIRIIRKSVEARKQGGVINERRRS